VLGFLELLGVAALSMILVDQITVAALVWLGAQAVLGDPAGIATIMTLDISVGTVLWMLHRRRTTRAIAAVVLAVAIAFALPLPAFWAGMIAGTTAVLVGHVLVVPALALVVALMPNELSTGRGAWIPRSQDCSSARGVLERIARRWPTMLALLLTFGKIVDPDVAPAWVLVVLGAEYLIIGAARKQFRNARLLVLHVAGAAAYAALALVSTFTDPGVSGILIGVGWILHAVWDGLLYRANVVVWRWFAEACAVFDIVVGVSAIAAVLMTTT
jgi:hypothetical protein